VGIAGSVAALEGAPFGVGGNFFLLPTSGDEADKMGLGAEVGSGNAKKLLCRLRFICCSAKYAFQYSARVKT